MKKLKSPSRTITNPLVKLVLLLVGFTCMSIGLQGLALWKCDLAIIGTAVFVAMLRDLIFDEADSP